jgi:hypothetical protein
VAASTKKRMTAVTALSATLLLGGVAVAEAHDSAGVLCAGKGKGEGTGAPGNDKGKGEGTGAPGKGKGQGQGTGAPSADRRHGCKDKDKDKDKDTEHPGGGSETPGTGSETPGTGSETPGSGSETPGGGDAGGTGNDSPVSVDVDIDVNVNADLPDPVEVAEDIAQDVLGIVTPVAVNAVGQTVQTAGQVADRAESDVSALVGLLDAAMAEATSFDAGSFEAVFTVSQDGATAGFNVSGTTSAGTGLVSRMLLAI